MKKISTLIIMLLISFSSCLASARDDVADFIIEEAMSQEQAKEVLTNEVRFYFGSQKHGKILKNWGEVSTNKKTNAFLKSDQEACTWAFLSALVSLSDRAIKEGGNAVINIKSNYKSNTTVSNTTYQCGAGNVMAGVALKGTIVKLP
jgi:uncharacterized protein YbjQ (UPF0145 family)